MAQPLQTKLLRVLQERQIRRVGDTKTIPISVRVLAASNESLHEKISTGGFREDLYYRLAVIPVEMPPLRERLDDVPLLTQYFIQKIAVQNSTAPARIDPDAMAALSTYHWPGNVRELENAVERACALCEESTIRVADLPSQVVQHGPAPCAEITGQLPIGQPLGTFVESIERRFIEETIAFNGGSRDRAAKMLGISMATLYRKLAD
jgi:DNA-binding NtrC family response regulator